MKQQEIALLLMQLNAVDRRHVIDDVKVQAWWGLLQQEAPDMTLQFAQQAINRHYATQTDMLMPAHLISAWRNQRQRAQDRLMITREGVPMPDWFPRM